MTQINRQIIHSYKGVLTFDIIEEILQKSKVGLDKLSLDLVVKKRVYTVLVECLENTFKHYHKDKIASKHNQVELILEKIPNNFTISISNYVNKGNLDILTTKIKKVNSLQLNELNQLYRESISKAKISDKGGAGLGIIEIARNSRKKIDYNVIKETGSAYYVNLQVKVADTIKTPC